jgi:hypothetical protein
METIYEPNSSFDYSKISLGQPQPSQGGSYFTKILFDDKPLYCQFPRCKTKQGVIQTDKKIYSDLLYDTNIHNELSNWLEHLETQCQKLIFDKRHLWFQNELELSEIESAFNTCSRMYKSGKQFLVRCYIPKPSTLKLNTSSCIVYDENENNLTLNHVDINKEIIPLLKIDGIKFTNRNFQIDIHILQIMVMNEIEEPKACRIKPNQNHFNSTSLQKDDSQLLSNSLIISKPNPIEKKTNETNETQTHSEINKNKLPVLNSINNLSNKTEEIKMEKISLECLETSDSESEEENDEYENNDDMNQQEKTKKNIHLEINNLETDDSEDLEVVQLEFDDIKDTVVLRKRNEVYYEIYKKAREKAKLAKKTAIDAYLEAKNIKSRYMLNDLDESDDDDLNFEY